MMADGGYVSPVATNNLVIQVEDLDQAMTEVCGWEQDDHLSRNTGLTTSLDAETPTTAATSKGGRRRNPRKKKLTAPPPEIMLDLSTFEEEDLFIDEQCANEVNALPVPSARINAMRSATWFVGVREGDTIETRSIRDVQDLVVRVFLNKLCSDPCAYNPVIQVLKACFAVGFFVNGRRLITERLGNILMRESKLRLILQRNHDHLKKSILTSIHSIDTHSSKFPWMSGGVLENFKESLQANPYFTRPRG
jgi:hypothetical protein